MSKAAIIDVGTYLAKIRFRVVGQRLIRIFTIALVVDLIAAILSVVLFNLWSIRLSIPFLFEILLVVLLLRDRNHWNLERVGSAMDKRFSLKDRLYSFAWYKGHEGVPLDTRQAQAEEIVEAVNFQQILKAVRFRMPLMLAITLPLFVTLLYLSWNSDYQPPGISTRVIQRTVQQMSDSGIKIAGLDSKKNPTERSGEPDQGSSTFDEPSGANQDSRTAEKNIPTESDLQGNVSETGEGASDKLAEPSEGLSSDNGNTGVGAGPAIPGGSDQGVTEHTEGSTTPPDHIDSVFQTQSISEPVPPALAMNSSFVFQELPDATNFLSLVPGQGGHTLAPLDTEIISNFEKDIDRFPEAYQKHLKTYYLELKKWDQ